MEAIHVTAQIVIVFIGIALSIWCFICWLGMHNNTTSGNSFFMLMPWIIFDKTEFTQKGNYWRILFLKVLALYLAWLAVGYAYFNYYQNPSIG